MAKKVTAKKGSTTSRKTASKVAAKGAATKRSAARPRAATKSKAATVRAPRTNLPVTLPPQRMILWDVENTSGEADLVRVLDYLEIDRAAQPTQFVAVGNWRSIGARIARLLAGSGAHLVHSAPAVGVRDWSDLWIAVAAGQWLARARTGDRLDIVSDDKAFEAVADTAAGLGVTFKRISYRTLGSVSERPAATALSRGQRRRAARRRAAGRSHPPAPATAPAPRTAAPPPATTSEDEAHAASHEQVRVALARLCGGDPTRWVSLDALANRLRTEGFTRPPGSPRLVTRLRRMKDVEVSPNGMVRLTEMPAELPAEPVTAESPAPAAPRRRRRRRKPQGAPLSEPPPAGATVPDNAG